MCVEPILQSSFGPLSSNTRSYFVARIPWRYAVIDILRSVFRLFPSPGASRSLFGPTVHVASLYRKKDTARSNDATVSNVYHRMTYISLNLNGSSSRIVFPQNAIESTVRTCPFFLFKSFELDLFSVSFQGRVHLYLFQGWIRRINEQW